MANQPWSKFYWSDWRSDPRLRMCGLAARGLWVEMLALMHEATPYGHLLISGNAPSDTQLAVLAGTPSEQIPDLLRELESAGVFSRTQKLVIYSRRMTRDEKKARTARKYGKTGGNPTLRKQTAIPPSDKGKDKPPDKTQRPEARKKEEKDLTSLLSEAARAMRSPLVNGQHRPNFADPAVRKQAWESKVMAEIQRTLPSERAIALITAYAEGEDWAREQFERVSARMPKGSKRAQ